MNFIKKAIYSGLFWSISFFSNAMLPSFSDYRAATAEFTQDMHVSARIGATEIIPRIDSGNLSTPSLPNTKIDVNKAHNISGGINISRNNWSIDIPVAAPFKHDIVGAGAYDGVGKLGESKALPVTLLMQYRILETDYVDPYVGFGPTYAKFYDVTSTSTLTALTGGNSANPTLMDIDSKLGFSLQIGTHIYLNQQKTYFVDINAVATLLQTTAYLSTGQNINVRLDPISLSLSVGKRF